MSRTSRGFATALAIVFVATIAGHRPVTGQYAGSLATIAPASAGELRQWNDRIEALLVGGDLRVARIQDDTLMPGRLHERLDQVYRGVRVDGAGVTRQLADGVAVSVFGTIYEGIDLDPTPALSVEDARAAIARAAGSEPTPGSLPELMIRPNPDGGYGLVYVGHAMPGIEMMTFVIDANTGALLDQRSDFERQVIGQGTGVHNDLKKVSARAGTGLFLAEDRLRPARITTYDGKGDLNNVVRILNNQQGVSDSNIAADTDNEWTDGPTVDAHASSGFFYDYLFKRFGRRGIDDNNLRIAVFIHPVRLDDIRSQPAAVVGTYYLNAFHCGTCGPDGRGAVLFGEGAPIGFLGPGITVHNFASAFDVVAHELTHGVTFHTSRLPGVGEGGSLNEAFSDILGLSAEFFHQPAGDGRLRADYIMGEDLSTPFRSFAVRAVGNPADTGNPDHYDRRNPARGIHFNSTIVSHAFYLAIEGGTNRTSGRSVRGVGASNREQMERVFFRAFTLLMPPNPTFALARLTTIQAARDLYGPGSAAERAVTDAWDAVGVQEQ
ncbi:MAG: M4 family metallopeptidase [Acidobacteria bacterium]|nr:M4 family metallopeptidase [Acidobacteriota bacterium]